MISVIYCTRNSNRGHYDHIRKTSGLTNKIEVIEIVNNGESLTKAYNRGLEQATNDIVVFCHDDIIFNKNGWGRKIIKHFKNTNYGILGIAGTTDLPENGKWWTDSTKMVGIVKHSHEGKTVESKYSSNFVDKIIETVIVDGLFFAIHKDRVKETFDEGVEGFHFYEIDFCFRNHLAGVKIGVMFDVKVTHKSIGQTNDKWEENRVLFAEKYKDNLPLNIVPDIVFEDKNIKLKKTPKVSVIIPTKGKVEMLIDCINSIYDNDNYPNLEIIIADTGSESNEISQIESFISGLSLKSNRPHIIKLVTYDYYNFAKINNDVVTNHVDDDTELLLFCNNDIKLLNNGITQMVNTYNVNKSIGTIGCRLHYGDNTVQHSGIIMSIANQQGAIGLSHKGLKSYHTYDMGNSNVLGNTAAFMMTSKELFNKIKGFNEEYKECFEDVEYNIECLKLGLNNIIVGEAVAYHYESQTRNDDDDKNKRQLVDLQTKLLPKIVTTRESWNYFTNISASNFENYFINRPHVNKNQHTN